MVGDLLGVVVFLGYGIVVGLAVVLAVILFRSGDVHRGRRVAGRRAGARWRSWWRRWR